MQPQSNIQTDQQLICQICRQLIKSHSRFHHILIIGPKQLKMSFYRSESVKHYNLILPRDNAEQIMNHIGQANLIHVEPLHLPILDRPFLRQAKRCADSLLRIREIEAILQSKSILLTRQQFTQIQYAQFFEYWCNFTNAGSLSSTNALDFVDRQIQQIWNVYKHSTKRIQQIKNKIDFLRDNLAIIKAGVDQFGPSFFSDSSRRFDGFQLEFADMGSQQINMKTGIIKIKEQLQLKRTVFRISRNNCFVTSVPYKEVEKLQSKQDGHLIFFLLFSGQKGGVLDKKLDRLTSGFSAQNYYLPQNQVNFNKHKQELEVELLENENLLRLNENQFHDYLTHVSEFLPGRPFSKFEAYKLYVMKEKQIYLQLNQMQIYNNFLKASVYVCRKDIEALQKCLKNIETELNYPSGQLLEDIDGSPPTLYTVNLFTKSAQLIVETYGVPGYKEANPAFFATVTFPFLFGVMFGDIAHGLLIFLLGLYLTMWPTRVTWEWAKMLLPYRYMIVLMGFFAIYCGLIYNDFMSISLNTFGSCYKINGVLPGHPIERISTECVYPVGLDPVWSVASNNLNFVDSLKMKLSVIIGVLHMLVGVSVKGANSLYFRRKLDFFFEFIPQFIFMIVLFGYMDFLIIFKWLKPWQPYDPSAPSIITTMINLPLKLGKTENCCGGEPLWGTPQSTSQNGLQFVLLVIAVVCVPMMLLPKPLIEIYRKKKEAIQLNEEELAQQKEHAHQKIESKVKQQSSSEIFVHQLIETIEYVLGSISNTASYLRLWALSLAHSQLSEVFFEKTVQGGIASAFSGMPKMIFGFPVLAAATFAVLLCMDSMECFLHTLRLHWVQFQNKFYKGNGRAFIAFNFQTKIADQLKNNNLSS